MVKTYKDKFNEKFKFTKGSSHSLAEISKVTGFKESGLKTIFNKGVGAYKTNFAAVRPSVRSPEQWGRARVYSAVMGGASARIDAAHLIKSKK